MCCTLCDNKSDWHTISQDTAWIIIVCNDAFQDSTCVVMIIQFAGLLSEETVISIAMKAITADGRNRELQARGTLFLIHRHKMKTNDMCRDK